MTTNITHALCVAFYERHGKAAPGVVNLDAMHYFDRCRSRDTEYTDSDHAWFRAPVKEHVS